VDANKNGLWGGDPKYSLEKEREIRTQGIFKNARKNRTGGERRILEKFAAYVRENNGNRGLEKG